MTGITGMINTGPDMVPQDGDDESDDDDLDDFRSQQVRSGPNEIGNIED